MTLTPTTEDYLQAIDGLQTERREVIAARLAERLRVSPASVSQTVDRMVRRGLVEVGDDHRITLTPAGRDAADTIVRRHRLTERFLTDILHLEWAQAHEEAHRLEHAISDLVEARLNDLLGGPETCPHGSPIPGNFPEGGDRDWIVLDTLRAGETATIVQISEMVEDDPELLSYCATKNLRPGVEVTVKETGPDDLILLNVAGTDVPVIGRLSSHIFCVARASARATA